MSRTGEPGWEIARMAESDLSDVLEIESASFSTPWTRDNFLFEIRSNPFARNLVVRRGSRVLAYSCLWLVGAELKINNIAVHPAWRRRGVGAALLRHVIEEGRAEGCSDVELEVRPSNLPARRMYETHGFRELRRRKGYYRDTGEDAIVMCMSLSSPSSPRRPKRVDP